ncbi:hypothetical protein [Pedobacter mendelii]|uniref:Uncharacterized protein n=1 Tax=Pedobacter mendelii TaxID=1908240 RepID=A0ABQ2BEN7_9SPHI|nr:hypothetical protein [Pedobacter mendelii]GGI22165.1 hypothetical protein GCM10008119_01280 [Pedobacter mendelii]
MNRGKNQSEENLKEDASQHLSSENQGEWDNDTYGHIENLDLIKKKNEPDEKHQHFLNEQQEKNDELDASSKLKNINLVINDDVSSRNENQDKGIGGKII